MPWFDIFQQQLVDPFRIGLVIALVATMARTRNVTGTLIPLLAGVTFVAVIIPATMSPPGDDGLVLSILTGFAANLVLLAVVMGLWQVYLRFMHRADPD
jgi:uncharacterized membrane protein (GlpM family)